MWQAVLAAPKIELKGADKELERYFEGCMPIEALAARGRKSLSFGPMRPVGLRDPRTGRRPCAVVQLRQDNVAGTLYNMVGFQTNMKWGAQEEVLRLIPGLAQRRVCAPGPDAPQHLHQQPHAAAAHAPVPQPRRPLLRRADHGHRGLCGQHDGRADRRASTWCACCEGQPLLELPRTTMIGALLHYITHAEPANFQPMKATMGLLPDTGNRGPRQTRPLRHLHRARDRRILIRTWPGLTNPAPAAASPGRES